MTVKEQTLQELATAMEEAPIEDQARFFAAIAYVESLSEDSTEYDSFRPLERILWVPPEV